MLVDRYYPLLRRAVWYRDVPASSVPGSQWDAVDVARAAVRADTGLPEPEVIFFKAAHPSQPDTWFDEERINGVVVCHDDQDLIRVRAGMGYWDTVKTALHELRHLDQHRKHQCPVRSREWLERDANSYSALVGEWLRDLLTNRSDHP